MERIHNLLRKIQDIYYKQGNKQVIDIDLMLDYTRVLYADLLDAKTDLLAKGGMGFHLKSDDNNAADSTFINNTTEESIVDNKETKVEEVVENNVETTSTVSEHLLDTDFTVESTTTNEAETLNVVETENEDLNSKVDEEVLIENKEPEVVETPNLHLETMNVDEKIENVKEQILINDDDFPSLDMETPQIYTEVHFELPEVKDNASESPKQNYAFTKKNKDIRSFIGINDKYQFMNEMFANNRTAYEESLDKLANFETFKEAESWMSTELLSQQKWNKDDETYLSLLQVVKKYCEA